MQLITVTDKKTEKLFLDVPRLLYKDDLNWVCPLDDQIRSIFDPEQNVFFEFGDAARWILQDGQGRSIGRVAAFINKKKAFGFDPPTGGMGFFECINDEEAAFMLFDQCKQWLSKFGLEAMDGPVNFGENDIFWGLLVEGFTQPGFGMNYNFPYYKDLFEKYGFTFYFEQVSNHLDLTKPFPERFWKIADWVRKKEGFSFKHFRFAETEQFISDMKCVYDDAWQFHENFTPINVDDLKSALQKAKAIIDEEFIWFAYHDNVPIAFLVMYPDANQIFKHLNGKLHLLNKIRFAMLKKRKTVTRARIVIMGVAPKFQRSGIESALFWHLDKVMKSKPHYSELELSWVGDFNPKMRALHESVGAVFGKRHITYRCMFDKNAEMRRSTIIPKDTKDKILGGEE